MTQLFGLDRVLKEVSDEIKSSFGFDFVAVQLVRLTSRIIETAYGSDIAAEWSGVARHYLDEDPRLQDIQVAIAQARPPLIEIIAGWDPKKRLDRWIFDTFGHAELVRLFLPVIVIHDQNGELVGDWFTQAKWEVGERNLESTGWHVPTRLHLPEKTSDGRALYADVIGTIEAGYRGTKGRVKLKHDDVLMKQAKELTEQVSRHAIRIYQARLYSVLEMIARCSMRIAGAASASVLYLRDPHRRQYIYKVGCGMDAHHFLDACERCFDHVSRKPAGDAPRRFQSFLSGCGHNGKARGAASPKLIKAIPFSVSENETGALYLGFWRKRDFSKSGIDHANCFLNEAIGEVRNYLRYKQARERAHRMSSLHSVVQSLANEPEGSDLLLHIAWNTLNTLAADAVTIYEYIEPEKRFRPSPKIAGRLLSENTMHTEIDKHDAPSLLVQKGKNVYASESARNHIFNKTARKLPADKAIPFVIREGIRSSAGILLKVGKEIVGVLFINYRRPHNFSQEERFIIDTLASAAAVAVKNRRLLEEFGAGERDVTPTSDPEQILSRNVKRAVRSTGAAMGTISLLDPVNQELVLQARHPDAAPVSSAWSRVKIGEGITGWVAINKQTALVKNLRADARHRPYFITDGSAICVPMLNADRRLLGVLCVVSHKLSAFNLKDQSVLEAIADRAAIEIQNAENQKQLVAAETTTALGNVAAPLVHYMKNELAAIKDSAHRLKKGAGDADGGRSLGAEIYSITEQMLQESSRLRSWILMKPQQVDLRDTIIRALELARVPHKVRKKLRLPREVPKVLGEQQQLTDVFVNLIQNALDAMTKGGELSITCKSGEFDGRKYVMVQVRDTGIGMAKGDLKKIFEPGTSMKKHKLGHLGFGLWWAKTYVERLGGRLKVLSKPNVGSRFSVLLPSFEPEETTGRESNAKLK
jgi:signal transduction histidine kinase